MFKNEASILKEWIEHYIKEGIDHFYLIDNGSTDNYLDKIKAYMHKITLIKDPFRKKTLGTQTELLNKHLLDLIKKETKWVFVIDIDEYIYSRNGYKQIIDYVNIIPESVSKIVLPWKMFGSNGIIEQPSSIISSFIKREDNDRFKKRISTFHIGHCKTLTRVKNITLLETHSPIINNNEKCTLSDFSTFNNNFQEYNIDKQNLHINHYTTLSFNYYKNIKMIRGGGQGAKYTLDKFNEQNKYFNEIEDIELKLKKY